MSAVLPGSKVLVTGANGYIATYLIQELLDQGYAVRGTVRSILKSTFLLDKFKSYGNKFELFEVEDFAKEGAFDEVVKDVDVIQHLAAPVAITGYSDPYDVINPVVNAMIGVLRSAKNAPNVKRVVVISSIVSIMLFDGTPRIFTEDDWNEQCLRDLEQMGKNTDPLTTYAAEKVLSEKAAWEFYKKHEQQLGWDLVVICFPWVFGPLHKLVLAPDQLNASSKVFYNLLTGGPIQGVYMTNHAYVDVRDLALGLVKSIATMEASGERIIISAGSYTRQEWLNMMKSLKSERTSDEPLAVENPEQQEPYMIQYDTTKAQRILKLQYRTMKETARDALTDFERIREVGSTGLTFLISGSRWTEN